MQPLSQTPLHSRHLALGAAMAPFAGWDMPLWYKAGAIKEHLAVVTAAGLFDTSHMDVLLLSGEKWRVFLDFAFTREIAGLRQGRCGYGAFLDKAGHCLDDAIIYPLDEERAAVVVNASMAGPIRDHLAGLPDADAVTIAPLSPRPAKLDLQGPASVAILEGLLAGGRETLTTFPYFSFKGDFDFTPTGVRLADGTPILLSRTGYTGETGFEIFLPEDRAGALWDAILERGAAAGVIPCGLAARDSLRTGAVLPLSHQDIGAWPYINHPWPFALPLAQDGSFSKKFFGSDALNAETSPHTLPFAGYDPRRVDPATAEVVVDGVSAGRVLTIVSDMAIGRVDGRIRSLASPDKPEGWTPRGLACGFIMVNRPLAAGCEAVLRDGRREIRIEIVSDIRPDRTARKKLYQG